ncbi:hypothetical protein [Bosea sp. RAC05]|uniref:hypothetical protein n=1 Tax=Bosea sp. RAC05 TaxID=1842539 RepID=UPI0012378A2A|nr:hypothetical protein [Bosea sp. RAC05]
MQTLQSLGLKDLSYRSAKTHGSTTDIQALRGTDQFGSAFEAENLVASKTSTPAGSVRWNSIKMTGLKLGSLQALDADVVNPTSERTRRPFEAMRLSGITVDHGGRISTMETATLAFGPGDDIDLSLNGLRSAAQSDGTGGLFGHATAKVLDGNIAYATFTSDIAKVSGSLSLTGAIAPRSIGEMARFLDLQAWLPGASLMSAEITVDITRPSEAVLIRSPETGAPIPAGAGMQITTEFRPGEAPVSWTNAVSSWKSALIGTGGPWRVTSLQFAGHQLRH